MPKVKHCHAEVMMIRGHRFIDFDTRANTHCGILRAAGKAIARQLGDDAIEVCYLSYKTGTPNPWSKETIVPTWSDNRKIFESAHDELFNLLYA